MTNFFLKFLTDRLATSTRLEDFETIRQRLAQKREGWSSSAGFKKARLSELELESAKFPTRPDHPRIVGTFSGIATNVFSILIVHPISAARQPSSSALTWELLKLPLIVRLKKL